MMYKSKRKDNFFEKGQAMILATILFLAGALIILGGIATPTLKEIRIVNDLLGSKKGLFVAEGALEDSVFRLKEALMISFPETYAYGGGSAIVSTQIVEDETFVTAIGDINSRIRTVRIRLVEGAGASFNYGMQADVGGIFMENNSTVIGNLYSNGPINGANSNLIRGEVVSAGPNGLIDGVHATSSGFANTIQNATLDGDAYYDTTIINTPVGGTEFPGSPDQATTSLPVTDEQISEWEADAQAGGIISSPCPFIIDSDMTIGPVKITCDLEIDKNSTVLTIAGSVWVTGNITTKNGPTIRADASVGNKSIPFIADNPVDRLTSSKIILQNTATFEGSGEERSYILMISQNEGAENSTSDIAIDVLNSVSGDLLVYAAHGEIRISNSVSLTEVSGWRIRIRNFAEIIYETGLASLLFTAGPSGGFVINDWREVE